MNSNEVVARLEQTNLSNEEKQLVRDKIAAGSINPSGWMYLNDLDLSLSLRNNIRAPVQALPPPDRVWRLRLFRLFNHIMSNAWALSGILFVLAIYFASQWLAFSACVINAIAGVASDVCTEINFESVPSWWQLLRRLCYYIWPGENGLIFWLVAKRILVMVILFIPVICGIASNQ